MDFVDEVKNKLLKNSFCSSYRKEFVFDKFRYASCTTIPPVLLYCFSLIYFLLGVQIYQTIESKSSVNLSSTSLFIGSMLSTTGDKTTNPKTQIGKLFLIFYLLFGIPLTFVVVQQFSEFLKRILRYLLDQFSSRQSEQTDFSIRQMIVFLVVYLFFGASFFSADSFIDRFYFSFMSLFTIEFHLESFRKTNRSIYFLVIFYLIGLSLLKFWFQTIQKHIEQFLFLIARKSVMNFFDVDPQIGKKMIVLL